ncbi:uncharacterized protein [Blastocystis hominis]|uniref:CRAL-TRIO domain-containing protein n=1 Tax=Blastocystis hominis TaxID=12968 RepID=D8LXE8_BLAHO|nr:uncharacterized protein [Blastocystis hominis]CBK20943.2 unnamed protein product [Blastocystis hominis]|eukprot:XP_012894991.1 uncharacterized protein [Blastocystis hominis]
MQNFKIPEEKKPALEEFKTYIKQNEVTETLEDQLLFRYLYTSNFNKRSALSRIQRLVAWRRDNNIDSILENEVIKKNHDTISRILLYKTHKTDRYGRPCTMFNVGHLNLRHILCRYSTEEIISAHIYYNEYMDKLSREASKNLGVDYVGNATIIDLDGLSLSRHMNLKAMSIFKEMILIHTYYYPETCDVIYVVNYPPIFNFFWNFIQPWMTTLQKQKLKRIPRPAMLLAYFKAEDLPKIYGGSCECEGGCVPGKAINEKTSAFTDVLTVHGGSAENVELPIASGETIGWYFSTLDREIDFKVLFVQQGKEVETVMQKHVSTQNSLESGKWKAGADGMMRLVFDNSKSSWGSCSVSYEVKIAKGGEELEEEEEWSVCLKKE